MKIITVLGARPQFIKASVVSREIKKHPDIQEVIVHTGQHFDANMSDVFFKEMGIPKPNYHLNISNLSHGAMTGRMLEKIEEIILEEKPDWLIVYGDTNSTLAGALAASKQHVKVAHIEAGLRSFNMKMPEEQNRILTDRLSTILFCPTDEAINNLHNEGFDGRAIKVIKSGDVMQDAALYYRKDVYPLSKVVDVEKGFILATVHRAENTDDPERLKSIIEALNELNESNPVVLPLHPRTKKIVETLQLELKMTVIDPVGYLQMISLLESCCAVVCDSGGLQKEAFFFEKPCVTLRDETEWVELIEIGVNVLAGADKTKIIQEFNGIKDKAITDDGTLYGAGTASSRIVRELLDYA